ncbi:DUF4013 domain-containing protein [Salinadaptatus halalkaliphilus]|uniref:DUF4013 domain-containing protein n=1 Tax=Salinadaptatus halalkaliphilus TaxID=2419781 RepID=A0A4S3TNE8_9EURY|nr:DUF4013 domain-containing protein [Salinadaptatus halalkaliphilus]THE65160.1 DUF4013 domain-containing protein [Salinadaptatus halalkaliphilus]
MLSDAITYLKHSDDVWKTSILGGLFLLFSFLLIPLFLVWGYVVRVLDRTAHGDEDAPAFDDWGTLAIDGAKASVILFAYSLVVLVVGTVLVGGVLLATGGSPGSVGAAMLVLAGLLTVLAGLVALYAVPAALANFAGERRLSDGVDFEAIRPVLGTGTYAAGWLLALGILFVGSFVAGILAAIPFVGAVLGAILSFYALVSAYYVIGRTWADLHPVSIEDVPDDAVDERPAV